MAKYEEETKSPQVSQTQYQVIFKSGNGMIGVHYIQTEVNLIEVYKNALLMGHGQIVWDKGVLDCSQIVGVTRF